MPGADKGVLYFITPVWDKILEPKVKLNFNNFSIHSLILHLFNEKYLRFGTMQLHSAFSLCLWALVISSRSPAIINFVTTFTGRKFKKVIYLNIAVA